MPCCPKMMRWLACFWLRPCSQVWVTGSKVRIFVFQAEVWLICSGSWILPHSCGEKRFRAPTVWGFGRFGYKWGGYKWGTPAWLLSDRLAVRSMIMSTSASGLRAPLLRYKPGPNPGHWSQGIKSWVEVDGCVVLAVARCFFAAFAVPILESYEARGNGVYDMV